MITISTDIANAIMTTVASVIQQLWVVFAVLIAITLTFFAVRKIIFFITLVKM